MNFIRHNWPILAGLATSLLIAAQLVYQLGSVQAEFAHAMTDANEEITSNATELKAHSQRPAHEQTAIRLERIETNQQVMQRDVTRINVHLDGIADDLKQAVRGRR